MHHNRPWGATAVPMEARSTHRVLSCGSTGQMGRTMSSHVYIRLLPKRLVVLYLLNITFSHILQPNRRWKHGTSLLSLHSPDIMHSKALKLSGWGKPSVVNSVQVFKDQQTGTT